MAGIFWAAWLALGVWGLAHSWRMTLIGQVERTPLLKVPPAPRGEASEARGRFPRLAGGTYRRGFSVVRVRLRWLSDWCGWVLALSVVSFAPALAPDTGVPKQAVLTLFVGAGLLRLVHALDSRVVGQGVVAGLGLIALLLDSLSGGAWARLGALGHGTEAHGVGLLYGTLALLWGLMVVRAWLSIEGNPLGAAVGMGALACWLGWKGMTPAVGWGGAATALALGIALLHRERAERRRVRLMLQNRVVRIVRRASNADLMLAGSALVGLCLLALWLSGAPIPQPPRFGTHAWLQAGVVVAVALGMWIRFALTPSPSPTGWERGAENAITPNSSPTGWERGAENALPPNSSPTGREQGAGAKDSSPRAVFPLARKQARGTQGGRATPDFAVLPGLALLTLLGGEPLAVAALASLLFWANTSAGLQEYPPHAPNLSVRTGGNE